MLPSSVAVPGENAAAIAAAAEGASVVLIEGAEVGGMCVHHSCIPTNILMNSAKTFVEAKELGLLGVFDVGDQFNFGRAVARKDSLVGQLAAGARMGLKAAKVDVVKGRARFREASTLEITSADGSEPLAADSFVIAAGTEWEKPSFPGIDSNDVLTADEVQSLAVPPVSALVVSDGPADTAFGVEYAALLAVSGTDVILATTKDRFLPALDSQIEEVAIGTLGDLGVRTVTEAAISGDGDKFSAGEETVAGGIIIAADVRRPFTESVAPAAAGVAAARSIDVDRACRTNISNIFAVGDVTGGAMLSNAAEHMGRVAALNATGGEARTRLAALPHVIHAVVEMGWVGLSEDRAKGQGLETVTGLFNLGYNARALTLGAKQGVVKVTADPELGEILGVQAIGPEAGEIVAVAAALIQAEVTVYDVADSLHWHPSTAEALSEAARLVVKGLSARR